MRVVNPNKKALEAEGWGKRSLDARRFPFLSAPFDSGSATIVGCPLIGPCGCDRLRRVQLSKKSDKMWICRWLHSAEAGCGAQKEIAWLGMALPTVGLVSETEALQLFTDAAASYLLLLFLFLPNDPHIRPRTP